MIGKIHSRSVGAIKKHRRLVKQESGLLTLLHACFFLSVSSPACAIANETKDLCAWPSSVTALAIASSNLASFAASDDTDGDRPSWSCYLRSALCNKSTFDHICTLSTRAGSDTSSTTLKHSSKDFGSASSKAFCAISMSASSVGHNL